MRAVIQRVSEASVTINGKVYGAIKGGFLILLGIENADNTEDIQWLCRKIVKLRIFADSEKAMNLALKDVDGDALIVSQFTLHASTKKGNRPSFIKAAKPDIAEPLYKQFIVEFEKALGKSVQTGQFGADMQINLCNDGPVTIAIDTKNKE